MKSEMTYETAMKQLEQIVASMESGQMPIDKMAENLKQSQELITFCKQKLVSTDEEIQKIIELMK